MRTRWLVLALGLSLVLNVLIGTALIQAAGRGREALDSAAAAAQVGADKARLTCPAGCPEERCIREELSRLLCTERPDRAALAAVLARLDSVRAKERDRVLDKWLHQCSKTPPAEREALRRQLHHALCPWNSAGEGNCAPSAGDRGNSAHPKP